MVPALAFWAEKISITAVAACRCRASTQPMRAIQFLRWTFASTSPMLESLRNQLRSRSPRSRCLQASPDAALQIS